MGNEKNNKPSENEQRRIDASENLVNWALEDPKQKGCIIIATDEESLTSAVIGPSKSLTDALVSAMRNNPNLRRIIASAIMIYELINSSESNTDKDK